MERLTEKLADGRNVLKENYAYVTNPKHGSFIEGKAVDKLAEYEQAEEQGLLIRLHCPIGGTLYQRRKDNMIEFKVIGVVYDILNKEWIYEVAMQRGFDWIKTVCSMECVGKTVFLTKAEAEQSLAKMKGV